MQKVNILLTTVISVLFIALFIQPAYSASIKDRMADRLPAINTLKDSGVVGENKEGFLEFRGAKKNADLVEAENKDRELVYQAIAKKQGATVELVGSRRAKQIVDIAKPGHWLQKPDGSWYKK